MCTLALLKKNDLIGEMGFPLKPFFLSNLNDHLERGGSVATDD